MPAHCPLTACLTAPNKSVQQEDFGSSNVFTHSFPGNETSSCEAARRALLSQGYVIGEMKTSFIKGRRKFQRDGDIHVEIEFSVVCAPDSKGSNSVTVFANAVRDLYSLKKTALQRVSGLVGSALFRYHLGQATIHWSKWQVKPYPMANFMRVFLIW